MAIPVKAVIDTNVLLIANGQHDDVSLDCRDACINFLREIQQHGTTVIDDGYRILSEYQKKTQLNPPKEVGDVFLKFLLRNLGNPRHVEAVPITETGVDLFAEFPDAALQATFDPSDRIFAAVAHAHPDKPAIQQAADCKWLDWWPALQASGIQVRFLCPEDACDFYRSKFPRKELPALPE